MKEKYALAFSSLGLLLCPLLCSGCLALSFGGKTEHVSSNPTLESRISHLERRISQLEHIAGVSPPVQEMHYSQNTLQGPEQQAALPHDNARY